MRVCITGATGFLGGALARALAGEGAELHGLKRRESDGSSLADVPITWHEGDLDQPSSLAGFVAGADWVIHAAGMLGRPGVPEEEYRRVNVEGTRHVLSAALSTGRSPRVLHLSSPGVLGPSEVPVVEDTPPHPTNAYERSKAAAEDVAREFAARGLPVVLARPGFVYGPGDRHVLGLFQAIQRGRFFLIDGGQRQCQPTFVDDAVSGMLAAARAGRPGEAYHVVGPRSVTFRELANVIATEHSVRPPRRSLPRAPGIQGAAAREAVAGLAGRTAPLSRTGVAFFSEDRVVSWEKAHRELGWAPRSDVGEGVSRTVAWYRQRHWL